LVFEDPNIIELWNLTIQRHPDYAAVKRYDSSHFSSAARNSNEVGGIMDEEQTSRKLGWTLEELANSLSGSVPFLRLEVKRGRLKAAHLGRRVVLLDSDVRCYLEDAADNAR
jgi:hypothetical protein